MTCEPWIGKLDAYFDGELSADEARAVYEHLRQCSSCATQGLSRVQQKLAVRAAGQKFAADPAFRARMQKDIAGRKATSWKLKWLPILATAAVVLIASTVLLNLNRERRSEAHLISELTDMHVAALASPNPVDVVSTDRHTVKPWFAGKIPFTFNLPELQNTPFILDGGRVSYLNQSPGAELIFRVRQHKISVFIFQEQGLNGIAGKEVEKTALSFSTRSWRQNGLYYFAISDAGAQDLEKLSELLKAAS